MSETRSRHYRPSAWIRVSMLLHVAGIAALVTGPSRWPWVFAGLWADHVSLLLAGLWPRSRVLGPNVRSLDELDFADPPDAGSKLALTFDDGPDPELTPRVLDLLDQHHARASFFCIGQNAEQHPELVREIAARGHSIENHTWSHSRHFLITPSFGVRREVTRTQELLTELTGQPPCYFRAPAGFRSPWLEPHLAREGLRLVSWTARGFDGKESNPEKVLSRLRPRITENGILMLHDGRPPADQVAPRHRLPILQVLPELLSAMKKQNMNGIALPNPYKTRKSLTPPR